MADPHALLGASAVTVAGDRMPGPREALEALGVHLQQVARARPLEAAPLPPQRPLYLRERARAIARSSSSVRSWIGCATKTRRASGWPSSARLVARRRRRTRSRRRAPRACPASSNSSTSRRPHDTQEPQSASASITASQRAAISRAHVGGRGLGERRLLRALDVDGRARAAAARARRGRRRRAACGCRRSAIAPRRAVARRRAGARPASRSRGRVEDLELTPRRPRASSPAPSRSRRPPSRRRPSRTARRRRRRGRAGSGRARRTSRTGISGSVTHCGSRPSGEPPAPRTSSPAGDVVSSNSRCWTRSRFQPASRKTRPCSGPTTQQRVEGEPLAWGARRSRARARASAHRPSGSRASWSTIDARRLGAEQRHAGLAVRHAARLRDSGSHGAVRRGARRSTAPTLPIWPCAARSSTPRPAAADVAHDELERAADRRGSRGCPGRGSCRRAFIPISLGVAAR